MPPPTLVPPARLGRLLASRRAAAGHSLAELAGRSHGWFTVDDLAAVEAGTRSLSDTEIAAATELYGVTADELVPQRAVLTVDLDEREIAAGDERRRLRGKDPEPDEVLATYLSLLYVLRHATPGSPLVLRHADLEVLSRALRLGAGEVETRLTGLMADPDRVVATRTALLRRRILVPVAGVVVAVLAAGTLVLVPRDDPSTASSTTVAAAPAAPAPVEAPAPAAVVPPAASPAPAAAPAAATAAPVIAPAPAVAAAPAATPSATAGPAPTATPAPAPAPGPIGTGPVTAPAPVAPAPAPDVVLIPPVVATPSPDGPVTVTPDGVGLIPPVVIEQEPVTETPDGVGLIPPAVVERDVPPPPAPAVDDVVPDTP